MHLCSLIEYIYRKPLSDWNLQAELSEPSPTQMSEGTFYKVVAEIMVLLLYFLFYRNSDSQQLGIDLALLRPLYQLYINMTKQESEPGSILPPVTRALTELFLQVENLAIVSPFVIVFVPRLFEEKRRDTVFGFLWGVVHGSEFLIGTLSP